MPDVPANTTTQENISFGFGNSFYTLDSAGDEDWFRLTVRDGFDYRYELDGEWGPDDEFFIPRLVGLFDSSGDFIEGTADANAEGYSWIYGALPNVDAGTYYVALAGQDPAATSGRALIGLYETMDDYRADAATTGRVTVGGSVDGNIETPYDEDWIAVELMAGKTYRVDQISEDLDPFITGVFGPDGNTLLADGDDNSGGWLDTRVFVSPTDDGLHYISAASFFDYTGSYTVSVTEVIDDYAMDATTTGEIEPGGTASGIIDVPQDVDWFRVTLDADEVYRVAVTTESYSNDSVYRGLFDTDGNLVSTGTNGDALSVSSAGEYFIAVGPQYGTGEYTVALGRRVQFTASSDADWINFDGGPGDDIIFVDGRNGDDTVSFAATDGPVSVNLDLDFARLGPAVFNLYSIENATGTSQGDIFYGSDRAETFRGLGGADTFFGSDGGRDIYVGGSSRDTVTYIFAREGVEASLLRERGGLGWAQDDSLRDIENLTGTNFDDTLTGDAGRNFLFGAHGDDVLIGNGGDDYILAGFGTDTIVFSGNRDEYTVTRDGIATTVAHTSGSMVDGTDLIGHAEILQFADGDFIL